MKRFITIALVLCGPVVALAQNFNPLLAAMLQDTLSTYVAQISNIKGLSVSVAIPGGGTWYGTAGVSHTGVPINSNMEFGIASNSKLFASTVMLKLAEQGTISLDDQVQDWLPSYPNVNPNITIRQLLNHTSGISDPIFVSPWMDTIMANPTRVFTPTEVLGWLGAPQFAVGTSWGYSNVNYILVGMIAEAATGQHISVLIRNLILNPLNMTSTFYDVEEAEVGSLAHRWFNTVDYNDTSRVGLNTAGGCAGSLFSTSGDMAKWYQALFAGQIISEASLDEMRTFVPTASATSQYGLGLFSDVTQGYSYWGHGGDTWGYKSKVIHDPCLNTTVCGLSNSFPSGMNAVVFLLHRAVKNHIPGCAGEIAGPTTLCQMTNSVTYSVPAMSNATSYVWTLPSGVSGTSSTNQIVVNFGSTTTSGYITVQGVNQYGPGGMSKLWVDVNPTPATPTISSNGNVLTSTAPSGNQWYNANGPIAGATGQTYTVTQSGNYYCQVTLLGCNSATSNGINMTVTGLVSGDEESAWTMYPNPANDVLFIDLGQASTNNTTVSIYNAQGQLMCSVPLLKSTQQFPLNELSSGIYSVQMQQGERVLSKRLLVQR